MRFFKYQACGNDYVYLDCFDKIVENPRDLAIKISNRNFGIGSDGLILILSSDLADAKMRIFNADGSEAKMCGNGIRCVGKYLFDERKIGKNDIKIDTLSGMRYLKVLKSSEKISEIRVNMGVPEIFERFFIEKIQEISSKKVTYLSVGNSHCVVFCDEIDKINIKDIGEQIQNLGIFKDGVNVEFVKVKSRNNIDVRVFERGSGETLACGTGACASVVSAIINGLCDNKVNVNLLGGNLLVEYIDGCIYMTGEAVKTFEGEYYV